MMVDWAVLNVMLLTRTCAVVPPDNVISSGRVIEFDNSTSDIRRVNLIWCSKTEMSLLMGVGLS
jgi:hypothetical protein